MVEHRNRARRLAGDGAGACSGPAGNARIPDVLRALDAVGYERWLVLEQDTAIAGQEPPEGDGPVLDVGRSIDYLTMRELEREVAQR